MQNESRKLLKISEASEKTWEKDFAVRVCRLARLKAERSIDLRRFGKALSDFDF